MPRVSNNCLASGEPLQQRKAAVITGKAAKETLKGYVPVDWDRSCQEGIEQFVRYVELFDAIFDCYCVHIVLEPVYFVLKWCISPANRMDAIFGSECKDDLVS